MTRKEYDVLVLSRRLLGVMAPLVLMFGFFIGGILAKAFGVCAAVFLTWGYWDLGRTLREDPVDPE